MHSHLAVQENHLLTTVPVNKIMEIELMKAGSAKRKKNILWFQLEKKWCAFEMHVHTGNLYQQESIIALLVFV